MKKSQVIFIIILLLIPLLLYLVITYQGRRIKYLENVTEELKENKTIYVNETTTITEEPSRYSGLGWVLAIIFAIVIIVLLVRGKTLQEFDYEKFIKDFRVKYTDPKSPVYQPLYKEVGCSLGYLKGNYKHQRVAVTFTDKPLGTNSFNGSPPRYMLHNYLVDPTNNKVHEHVKNITHDEFKKYCRDVEFRSIWIPQAPHETSDPQQQAVQEWIKWEGLKKGAGIEE